VRRFRVGGAAIGAAAVGVVHAFPSVAVLGQWTPLRAIPGLARLRGPACPAVALTFDDGPDPVTTPAVLDRLDELGIRATFFVLGARAARHPDIVAEIRARGHEIGCHGHRHAHHLLRSPAWVRADLGHAVEVLRDLGVPARWFRPPYGQLSTGTVAAARRTGVDTVLWSAWGREWVAADAAEVGDRVTAGLAPGAIVLLHDSDVCSEPGTVDRVVAALGPVADALSARALEACTLSQLVGARAAP
jgi:peptidoglycan/xylan/chitin deacetylase (PgdA/CDA1 family)